MLIGAIDCQLGEPNFPLATGLSLLGQLRPLVACVGQLHVDWVFVSCSAGMEEAPLLWACPALGCFSAMAGPQRGNGRGAVWLFTSVRGLRAVAQGVSAPGFPWNFQPLGCDLGCFRPAVASL